MTGIVHKGLYAEHVRVYVEPDEVGIARKAASIVADVVATTPNAVLALPTGNSPLGMYRELVWMHRYKTLDFSRTRIFNLDEYLGVAPTDERSFHHYLREQFLSLVNVPPSNVHLLSSSAAGQECAIFEAEIRDAGGIDLAIVGVGVNGHIAFNEPGSAFDSRTRVVELAQPTISKLRASFRPEEMPTRAVTMGIATLLEARKILALAWGETKRTALAGLLHGPVTSENPVSAIRLHPDATVITDRK